jgi:hypothetical protein
VFDNIAIYFHNNIGGIQSHPFRNTNATAAPLRILCLTSHSSHGLLIAIGCISK